MKNLLNKTTVLADTNLSTCLSSEGDERTMRRLQTQLGDPILADQGAELIYC